jgi:hypothetical protein
MRWILLALSVSIAGGLWLPGQAAEPAAAAPPTAQNSMASSAADDTITFAQYRDWRNDFIARRRDELASQLAAPDLPAARKARLQQAKAYYDWLAGLSDSERDRRFRERFDQIDHDHNGVIDRAERTAWHDKQAALYHRSVGPQAAAANSSAR